MCSCNKHRYDKQLVYLIGKMNAYMNVFTNKEVCGHLLEQDRESDRRKSNCSTHIFLPPFEKLFLNALTAHLLKTDNVY